MEIEKELKDKLKQQRLDQYKMQIFNLEMDLAAHQALADMGSIERTQKAIEDGRKAYKAVEAM